VPEEALTAVPARARIRDRTYNSAVTVREWAKVIEQAIDFAWVKCCFRPD
jgi:hypothetical protein